MCAVAAQLLVSVVRGGGASSGGNLPHTGVSPTRSAEDQPLPTCPETMVRQMAEHVELNPRAPPMREALPFDFPHFEISNDVPTDSELRKVVRVLKNGRAGGATGMRAKHIKV